MMGKKRKVMAAAAVCVVAVFAGVCAYISGGANGRGERKRTVRIGVAVYNEKDAYISDICMYLDDEIRKYEKGHPDVMIRREISDAGGSQQEQNNQIERFISLEYDLLLVNIVDRTNASVIIDSASAAKIPVVFFNREPVREDIFRKEGIYYEGSNAKESALLQAGIIADALETLPESVDRNGNGTVEFAMLEGESNHQDTLIRSEWVLKGLDKRGVPIRKVVGATANWERGQAKALVKQWMQEYPGEIELIICNNDDMAIGSVEALDEVGEEAVAVVGIDGVDEVQKLVEEGRVLGTVLCDTKLHAKALMEFIAAFAIEGTREDGVELLDGRYYMIPLRVVG